MNYLDQTLQLLDHSTVILRLKAKYSPRDVDRFEIYINGDYNKFHDVLVNDNNVRKITQDYFYNIDISQLPDHQKNNLLLVRLLEASRNSNVFKNGLITSSRIEEFAYILQSGSSQDLVNLIQTNNIYKELYDQTLIRRPDILFDLHKKGLIHLEFDTQLDIMKRHFQRLIEFADSNVDPKIIKSSKYILDNDILNKLSNGLIDQIDDVAFKEIIINYSPIKSWMQINESSIYESFINSIAKVRADIYVENAQSMYAVITEKLAIANLSEQQIKELLDLKSIIEGVLTKPSRFSQTSNQQFMDLCSKLGLTYEEGIQRFYVEVTYTFNGIEYTKKFPKFDYYSDQAVSLNNLIGQSADFSRGNQYLGTTFNPNFTTQHHTEDGFTLMYISTDIHKAIIHDGGASLLRVEQRLKVILEALNAQ